MPASILRVLSATAVLAALLSMPVRPVAVSDELQTTPSLLADFQWRNIGPANMAGRVTDIEALESGGRP